MEFLTKIKQQECSKCDTLSFVTSIFYIQLVLKNLTSDINDEKYKTESIINGYTCNIDLLIFKTYKEIKILPLNTLLWFLKRVWSPPHSDFSCFRTSLSNSLTTSLRDFLPVKFTVYLYLAIKL